MYGTYKKYVNGWDDPRLPTLNGLRRRGYTPQAINNFCADIGVSRVTGAITDYLKLENAARQDLDANARRAMVVLDPLKVVLENYPEGKVEYYSVPDFPADASKGSHKIPFQRIVYIDRSDFRVDGAADKNFFGLAPGKTCFLKGACRITATGADVDADGNASLVRATYEDSTTPAADNTDSNGKKVKLGVLTWVASPTYGAEPRCAEVRLYDRLFTIAEPGGNKDWLEYLNKDSLKVKTAYIDESLACCKPLEPFQFERVAFFVADLSSTEDNIIFNRVVPLKESKEKK